MNSPSIHHLVGPTITHTHTHTPIQSSKAHLESSNPQRKTRTVGGTDDTTTAAKCPPDTTSLTMLANRAEKSIT